MQGNWAKLKTKMLASFLEEKELFSVVSVLVFLFTDILGKSKCGNSELSRDKD